MGTEQCYILLLMSSLAMTQPKASTPMSTSRLLLIVVVLSAIIGTSTGFATAYFTRPPPAPVSREFYLFTSTANFNDTLLEQTFGRSIPHDIFLPDTLTVNKGDTVLIHFYNTEDEAENHTFTMNAPYTVDKNIAMQTRANITFVANTPGLFTYYCRFHEPTMTGYLRVQD